MSTSYRNFSLYIACTALAIGCTGTIGNPGTSPGGPNGPSGGGGSGGSGGAGGAVSACGDKPKGLPPARIWRLDHEPYARSIGRALGLPKAPDVSAFPADAGDTADLKSISPTLGQYYWETAASVADGVDVVKLLPCAPASPDDEACVRSMTVGIGRKAWRRPLTAPEVESLVATYRAVKGAGDGTAAVRAVVRRLLLSPYFLFRTELGDPDPSAPGRRVLSAHEVASELSYLVWDEPPDDTLAAAADDGSLLATGRLGAELARMLRPETEAKPKLTRTFQRWLEIGDIAEVSKDPTMFPLYSPAVMRALGQETQMLVEEVLWRGDGSLKSLLLAPFTFASATTAELYGVTLSGTAMQRITPNPAERLGVLTHPSVWAAHAQPTETGIPGRGKFGAEGLLCLTVPEPPDNVPPFMPQPASGLSVRQQWERHRSDPICAGCHALFDPIGFGFENYDALGVWRTKDEFGGSIDASGDVMFSDGSPPVHVNDGVDFVRKLAERGEGYQCFARHFFRQSFGRKESPVDDCTLETVDRAFADSGYSIPALVASLVASDGFRFRSN